MPDPQGPGYDCCCERPECPACAEMTPSHVEATLMTAALDKVNTAMREPTEDDIPRDVRGSFAKRLGSVTEMTRQLHDRATNRCDRYAVNMLEMIAEKLGAIIDDMALADKKEESDG